MIAGLKPYAEYKDSALTWLGEVPSHWDVRRIKTVLSEVDRRSAEGREPLLSLRMQAGLVDHHASGGRPIPPAALVGYKRVLPGEIVMNRMRASAGLFATATTDGLVSPDYAIFRAADAVNMAYLVELFRTPAMKAIFRLESTGLGTGESGFLRLYSERVLPLLRRAPFLLSAAPAKPPAGALGAPPPAAREAPPFADPPRPAAALPAEASSAGRKRSAAFGIRSTSRTRSTSTERSAVILGRSFSSTFSTPTITG